MTSAARCPEVTVDGKLVPMQVRSEPGEGYPSRTCALLLPEGTREAAVLGHQLALPKADPQTILLFGDTGCRMKGEHFQDCNDPEAWPFARIAEQAARQNADLMIHLGDYLYRESPCPEGNLGCKGSPWGDSLPVWQEDFLKPAAPLLWGVPWLLLRGNHEECSRAGKGWSRLFDPTPFDAQKGCNAPAAPLLVRLGALDLLDIDNSSSEQKSKNPEQAAQLRAWLEAFEAKAEGSGRPLWYVMHRPLRSVVLVKDGKVIGGNPTLAAAMTPAPKRLQYVWSGHQHTFQVLNWTDGSAPQLIAGHGGDALDPKPPAGMAGLTNLGKTIASAYSQASVFGFVLLKKGADGWTLFNHDRDGVVTMQCQLGASVVCAPVEKK